MTMTNNEFYHAVADILGTTYDCEEFPWKFSRRTRWNNRAPGSGRYPEHGIVRIFGDQVHIALTCPKLSTIVNSKEEALQLIRSSV